MKLFSSKELAERWHISTRTLCNWRVQKRGPKFVKYGWAVLYPEKEITGYERRFPLLGLRNRKLSKTN